MMKNVAKNSASPYTYTRYVHVFAMDCVQIGLQSVGLTPRKILQAYANNSQDRSNKTYSNLYSKLETCGSFRGHEGRSIDDKRGLFPSVFRVVRERLFCTAKGNSCSRALRCCV